MTDVIANMMTIAEVAHEMGITKQRVHQLIDLYELPVERPHPRLTLMKVGVFQKLRKMDRPNGVRIHQR